MKSFAAWVGAALAVSLLALAFLALLPAYLVFVLVDEVFYGPQATRGRR